jgi:hypothetical protein
LANNIIRYGQIPHEFIHIPADVTAWLPTALEPAIETMIADSVA